MKEGSSCPFYDMYVEEDDGSDVFLTLLYCLTAFLALMSLVSEDESEQEAERD